ncbi:MAG: AraC family transcriptional regulator [Betaproteobacteria bacterium]|nr:MAG: AraC family transcriptional regulator [Betaproteobacteria bacterium]
MDLGLRDVVDRVGQHVEHDLADHVEQLTVTEPGGDALKRVALDVGYGSASALSRAFAARVGASPRAWLQAQRAAE